MDALSALEMLIRSAEAGSFSGAARQLGLSPAAVSKQIGQLEATLGQKLVHRTTRKLSLTEAGAMLVASTEEGVRGIRDALAGVDVNAAQPRGVLKLSVAPAFGRELLLPLLGPFLAAYPDLKLDWHFENRRVDLVAEGFDAGIGGGLDLAGGLVARPLAPLHLVPVAAPAFVRRMGLPMGGLSTPDELEALEAVVMRSSVTGRTRPWLLQRRRQRVTVTPKARIWLTDPDAVRAAALMGYGVALLGMVHIEHHLKEKELVPLVPGWHVDAGNIVLYYPTAKGLPPKTRRFVDFVTDTTDELGWMSRFRAPA